MPFSYGIDALREAIGGFYGNFFARDLAVLAAIFVVMIVLGIVLGPIMSNVTRMAARQIREGDLYNGEDAVVPERSFRISQMISAFSDREDFRKNLEHRYARFSKMYPIFIRTAIVLAVGVPVVLAFMLALDAGEKAVLLTVVLLWLVALLVFVLVVESMRSSFERQLNLEGMSTAGATRLFFNRDRLVPALAGAVQRGIRAGKDEAVDEEPDGGFDEVPAIAPIGEVDEASDETSGEAPAAIFDEDPDEVLGGEPLESEEDLDETFGSEPPESEEDPEAPDSEPSESDSRDPQEEGGADA